MTPQWSHGGSMRRIQRATPQQSIRISWHPPGKGWWRACTQLFTGLLTMPLQA